MRSGVRGTLLHITKRLLIASRIRRTLAPNALRGNTKVTAKSRASAALKKFAVRYAQDTSRVGAMSGEAVHDPAAIQSLDRVLAIS